MAMSRAAVGSSQYQRPQSGLPRPTSNSTHQRPVSAVYRRHPRYRKLTVRGLIFSQDHADVVAALLLRQVPGQVQARLGDSLYLIGPPDAAVVKIGRSGAPEERLRGLSRGSPVRLVIHHAEPGLGIAETTVHKMLDDRRLHGEWFDFTDADPVRTVRDILRAIPDLDWLWAVPRAYQAIAAELDASQDWRPRRVQAMLRNADQRYGELLAAAAEDARAERERHSQAVAAANYPERARQGGESLWRSLRAIRGPSSNRGKSNEPTADLR